MLRKSEQWLPSGVFPPGQDGRGMTVAIVQDRIFLNSTLMPKHKMLLSYSFFNESYDNGKSMENFVELAER
jgi:hypothetical protein